MQKLTAKSTFKTGQHVVGEYFGHSIKGVINGETRPTPDYKNIQFVVDLDKSVTVFGQERKTVYIETNHSTNWVGA